MKHDQAARFLKDWEGLTSAERKLFRDTVVPGFSNACDGWVANPGGYKWPKGLRVKKLKDNPGIWEMTPNFERPAIRATFEFREVDGEMRVMWRRVGSHDIFKSP